MFTTLSKLLAGITRTFGDPDIERMAPAQLHCPEDDYGHEQPMNTWPGLRLLASRTSFNEAALEDTFI